MRYCHLDGLQGKAPADLSDPLPTGVFIQFAEYQYYRRRDPNFNLTGEKTLANSVSTLRIVNKRAQEEFRHLPDDFSVSPYLLRSYAILPLQDQSRR